MIRPIRYYGDPVLRRPSRRVTRFDEELRQLVADMIETMHDDSGVGLAAPQVGVPLRLFVASEYRYDEDAQSESHDGEEPVAKLVADHVMVNPEILERNGSQFAQEGCLSIPGLYVDELERDMRVTVRFQDVLGEQRTLEASGHFAQVIQHEYDHLDGILFFDRLPQQERTEFLERHRSELARIQRDAKALLKELRAGNHEKSRG